jgi:transcriptional regulator with XRE-family HTH domain
MSIGRFIQDLRVHQGLSVEDVAIKANVSVGTLRACEQGRRLPSAMSLKRMLSALGEFESTWIDTVTWKNPLDGEIFVLVPMKGGHKEKGTYKTKNKVDNTSNIRLEAIEAILTTDIDTLKAIITLIEAINLAKKS